MAVALLSAGDVFHFPHPPTGCLSCMISVELCEFHNGEVVRLAKLHSHKRGYVHD